MRINRNSWHYKIAMWLEVGEPRDLCEYAKTFLLSCLLGGVVLVACALLGGFIVLAPFIALSAVSTFGTVFVMLLWLGVVWVTAGIFIPFIPEDHSLRTILWRSPPRQPSIIAEYFRARKDKFCPFIEYDQ